MKNVTVSWNNGDQYEFYFVKGLDEHGMITFVKGNKHTMFHFSDIFKMTYEKEQEIKDDNMD